MSDKVSFDMVLSSSTKLPMVRINREDFLRKELSKHYSQEIIDQAVWNNPAYAGIAVNEIDDIAKSCIRYETLKVSSVSFAAGLPGGVAMAGTIPADLAQYFGHILRILQKLIYLYGWSELFDGDGDIDDETASLLTLFVGIMFGVSGAGAAITKISATAAEQVSKSIAQKALTKGAIYPIVKKIAQALGVKMTKDVFAKSVSKAVPIVGGVASGGLTYATYKPMAKKLKKHLSGLELADVDYYRAMR